MAVTLSEDRAGEWSDANAPHVKPEPDGLTDQPRWGKLGGRPKKEVEAIGVYACTTGCNKKFKPSRPGASTLSMDLPMPHCERPSKAVMHLSRDHTRSLSFVLETRSCTENSITISSGFWHRRGPSSPTVETNLIGSATTSRRMPTSGLHCFAGTMKLRCSKGMVAGWFR